MSDVSRAALEAEPPVNPYSLLDAVNRASETVHTAWLIFLAVISYLLITTAGVTHKDLLLNTDIPLPVLQVRIDLGRFFFFAPIILVLFHTGVVSQMVLLARKALEFDQAIRLLETTDRRTHPLRLETDNFFFVQALVGPERARIMGSFLHGMTWLTLVVLPVLVLLYIQVVFLPFHDITITTAHRVAIVADILMLATVGAFLARPEASLSAAFSRVVRSNPVTAALSAVLFALVILFSFVVATIPGETLDRFGEGLRGRPEARETLEADGAGFAIPLLRPAADGSLFGLFYRNLVVTDADLTADRPGDADEPASKTINLRGRDLRYARLDRSTLNQADLTSADLEGASLVGTDLRKALLGCGDVDEMLLSGDRERARCTDARNANFSRAKMDGARLVGIDLRHARLIDARIDGADMRFAILSGATLTNAHLDRVDLSGSVEMQGASFLLASMQGADLTNARATLADFTNASLQGATLAFARLEGTLFRDADLEGADLRNTRLFNADFAGARVATTDWRGASVWQTTPPSGEGTALVDAGDLKLRAPDTLDASALREFVARIESRRLKERLQDGLVPIIKASTGGADWLATGDAQRWIAMQSIAAGAGDTFRQRLTESLARLACRARFSNGSVLTGVARRAQSEEFRGDLPALYVRLRAEECAAGKAVGQPLMRELGTAADIAQGQ
ncbi:MAG: pentapeptide repeat-containing protein [Gammaproteobacteria bacterium]|nr:pentapeptide repeat-containing protein [Gammaproteobacteria bacterium]